VDEQISLQKGGEAAPATASGEAAPGPTKEDDNPVDADIMGNDEVSYGFDDKTRAKQGAEARANDDDEGVAEDETEAGAKKEPEAALDEQVGARANLDVEAMTDDQGGDYDEQIPTGKAAAVAGDGPLSDLLWGEPEAVVSMLAPLPPPAPPPTQPPALLPATAPEAPAPAPAMQVGDAAEEQAEVRTNLEIEANADQKVEAAADMNDIIETDARRNKAEGYVFNMRDKIAEGDEYGEFISAADREKFTSDLTAAEDWLYDDANGTKAQYVVKYGKLKATRAHGADADAGGGSEPSGCAEALDDEQAEVSAKLEVGAKAEEEAGAAAATNDIIEIGARRNDFDGYVFEMRDVRDKIVEGGVYEEFISAADREKFTSELMVAEDWLYDDRNGTKAQFVEKYAELKATGDAVAWRFKEARMRNEWITAVAVTINNYRKASTNPGDKYGHIAAAKLGSIVNECNEVEKWLNESKARQEAVPKHEKPVLICADMKRKNQALEHMADDILKEPMPAPPKPEKKDEAPPENEAKARAKKKAGAVTDEQAEVRAKLEVEGKAEEEADTVGVLSTSRPQCPSARQVADMNDVVAVPAAAAAQPADGLPRKLCSPNRLVVEGALNDDNSVTSLSLPNTVIHCEGEPVKRDDGGKLASSSGEANARVDYDAETRADRDLRRLNERRAKIEKEQLCNDESQRRQRNQRRRDLKRRAWERECDARTFHDADADIKDSDELFHDCDNREAPQAAAARRGQTPRVNGDGAGWGGGLLGILYSIRRLLVMEWGGAAATPLDPPTDVGGGRVGFPLDAPDVPTCSSRLGHGP